MKDAKQDFQGPGCVLQPKLARQLGIITFPYTHSHNHSGPSRLSNTFLNLTALVVSFLTVNTSPDEIPPSRCVFLRVACKGHQSQHITNLLSTPLCHAGTDGAEMRIPTRRDQHSGTQ